MRLRLRSETATHHQKLEDGLRLLSPDLTAERYRKILEGFFAVHKELESHLADFQKAHPDSAAATLYLPTRKKLAWLFEDLGWQTDRSVERNVRPFDLRWANEEAALWGLLYVIEGSTLGGQVLNRGLKSFSLVGLGTRYFESYRSDVGRLWQQFGQELSTLPESWHDAIVKAADRMFAELGRHFQEVAPS